MHIKQSKLLFPVNFWYKLRNMKSFNKGLTQGHQHHFQDCGIRLIQYNLNFVRVCLWIMYILIEISLIIGAASEGKPKHNGWSCFHVTRSSLDQSPAYALQMQGNAAYNRSTIGPYWQYYVSSKPWIINTENQDSLNITKCKTHSQHKQHSFTTKIYIWQKIHRHIFIWSRTDLPFSPYTKMWRC